MGTVDIVAADTSVSEQTSSRGKYIKYTAQDRFKIGKYASENGSAACVRAFKDKFTKINESTVRGFQKRYEQELAQSKGKKFTLATQKQGRPLLLGRLD